MFPAQRTSTSAAGKSVRLSRRLARAWAAGFSSSTIQHGEQAEHGGRLLERDLVVAAVASVPAERCGAKPRWLFREDQESELEGLGEADVLELDGGGSGGEEVAVVERSAEPRIGRATRGHANACSHKG